MNLKEVPVAEDSPKRRDSDVSKSSSCSSGSNPLMTLVDAAATIDTKKGKAQEPKVSGEDSHSSAKPERDAAKEMDISEANDVAKADEDKKEDAKPTATEPSNVLAGTKEDLMGDAKKKTFAEQLYDILEDEEHHDVLQWMPDGDSFTIVDHKKFILNKMPKLFNIRNMSSFVRKLGRWGFSRVHEKATRNSDIFKHPMFERGKRDQCKKKVKCVGRNANKTAPPLTPMTAGHPRYPSHHHHHLHTVSPRYNEAPLSPNSQMFMSNFSERSHLSQLSQLSASEGSAYSLLGGSSPGRVTFLGDHLPRLPSDFSTLNDQIPQHPRFPERLPLCNTSGRGSGSPDSPTKQRALSKVTAASEASAAALFSQHQKHRPSGNESQASPFEEARRLSELDRQLAEQQVALEHRKVALEHQRIIRQRQALMSQRRAVERQVIDRRELPHDRPQGDSASATTRELSSTSETSVAVSLDNSSRSAYSPSSRQLPPLSREEAIRALLREERHRSYSEARQRERQFAGHPSSLSGTSAHSNSADRRPSAW